MTIWSWNASNCFKEAPECCGARFRWCPICNELVSLRMFFYTHLCTETRNNGGPSCFRWGRWLVKWANKSPNGRAFGFETGESKWRPQDLHNQGKGEQLGLHKNQLGWRFIVWNTVFFTTSWKSFCAVMLVKKGTRIFVDPHFGWLMLTSIRSRHHILLGNNFWEHFHRPTPVKQQEIFWKELKLTKLSVIGHWLLDFVFSKWPKNFVLYFLFERSLGCFNLGFPMI